MITLSDKFKRDISYPKTNVYPIIIIDNQYYISTIKEYLEVSVKNDEHLIKMMAVIQRLQNNTGSGGGDSLLTDEELKQLQQIAEEVAKVLSAEFLKKGDGKL